MSEGKSNSWGGGREGARGDGLFVGGEVIACVDIFGRVWLKGWVCLVEVRDLERFEDVLFRYEV